MTEYPSESVDPVVSVRLSREEVETLLLAVDALQPLLDRLRDEIAPPPVTPAATAGPSMPADDALTRATRLARQSLREARRFAAGERRITPEQRKAWQEAARRYWVATRRSVRRERTPRP
jgi:hypothetical protein